MPRTAIWRELARCIEFPHASAWAADTFRRREAQELSALLRCEPGDIGRSVVMSCCAELRCREWWFCDIVESRLRVLSQSLVRRSTEANYRTFHLRRRFRLCAQRVVTALAGYVVIMRGNTFTVGDRITMGGVRGDVIALTFMQTKVMEMGQPPAVQGADPAVWVRSRQFTGRIVTVTTTRCSTSRCTTTRASSPSSGRR